MDRRQEARAKCVCAHARGMRGEAEGADRGDESGAGGVETAVFSVPLKSDTKNKEYQNENVN